MAPEKIQGWRSRSERSRPGASRRVGRAARAACGKDASSADGDAEHAAEREHSCARVDGVAAGEERQRRADGEEPDGGESDRPGKRVRTRTGEVGDERHERAGGERAKRARRGAEGRAELAGIQAELLARERVERVL